MLSVHPASPVLLTKLGPLGDQIRVPPSFLKGGLHAHSEFENKLR
jgi:hypothetical protein